VGDTCKYDDEPRPLRVIHVREFAVNLNTLLVVDNIISPHFSPGSRELAKDS
jgi:hypothetical protein